MDLELLTFHLYSVSMNDQILRYLDAEIARLQQARRILAGSQAEEADSGAPMQSKPRGAKRARRKLSPEARKRISDAQKKRWAAVKKK